MTCWCSWTRIESPQPKPACDRQDDQEFRGTAVTGVATIARHIEQGLPRRAPTARYPAQVTFRKLLAALAIIGVLASGVGIASLVLSMKSNQQQTSAPQRTPPQPPPPSVPTVKEFLIGVNVTAQTCDPAGTCVYTYTIDPKYVGLHPFPETPFTVEYEVTGGNQPQPGKFTVHGKQAEIFKDVQIEGPPGATLQVRVLRIFSTPPPPPPPPAVPPPPVDGPAQP